MAASIPTDIEAVLKKFDSDVEQMVKDALDGHEAPATIYHYTNDVGLKGILESGRLWLTDIFNLNDPSELRHGFHGIIEAWKGKGFYGWAEAEGIAAFLKYLDEDAKFREAAHLFTCSFSADGEDLGQWRAYADDGRGYALGFDRAALERAFIQVESPSFAQAFRIQYDNDRLTDLQNKIVEKALPLIRLVGGGNLTNIMTETAKRRLAVSSAGHALYAATFFKHKAYRNEQEYRFLEMFSSKVTPPDVKIRTRPYSLVRYREFDWRAGASGALKGIVVGPAADRDKAPQFARDCLRSFHVGTVELTSSNIPYRAL